MIKSKLIMMPTLKQIKRLNELLLDLYSMHISPEVIKFSYRGNRPFIIVTIEPIHDIRKERWFTIDLEGVLRDKDEKQIF